MASEPKGSRRIIHVDLDAFYASVEQLDNPLHRGKPVIVGADPKGGRGRGVVSACSYEARAFGVRSAMPISEAYRRCPQGVYLPVRMARYQELAERVQAIFWDYTDLVEPISIDEAFLDVTRSQRAFGPAEAIAQEIKGRIREEESLVASVGVAPNKFVAKVASDLEKPDGFVVVRAGEEREFLSPLPVSRLWGVGKKTEGKLKAMGLGTIGQLAELPEDTLRSRFGKLGSQLHLLSRGIDEREVIPAEEPKSIGKETTFPEDVEDRELLERTLLALSDEVSRRLRREGYLARGLTLKLRYEDFTTLTRARPLTPPSDLTADLYPAALGLLAGIPLKGRRIRLLGVSASGLLPRGEGATRQLEFFQEGKEREHRLAEAVDKLKERYGRGALTLGSLIKKGKVKGDEGAPESGPAPREEPPPGG